MKDIMHTNIHKHKKFSAWTRKTSIVLYLDPGCVLCVWREVSQRGHTGRWWVGQSACLALPSTASQQTSWFLFVQVPAWLPGFCDSGSQV